MLVPEVPNYRVETVNSLATGVGQLGHTYPGGRRVQPALSTEAEQMAAKSGMQGYVLLSTVCYLVLSDESDVLRPYWKSCCCVAILVRTGVPYMCRVIWAENDVYRSM